MPEAPVQPAAHRDAKADTRTAAKWLIAAFAGVGSLLISGIGLSNLGHLEGGRLELAIAALLLGLLAVLAIIYTVADVLTPAPITLSELAEFERARNERRNRGRNDELVEYIEADPSLVQGIVASSEPPGSMLITANARYRGAVDDRFETAEAYWDACELLGEDAQVTVSAKARAVAASNRASTMHGTVRRLEEISSSQQTVLLFGRARLLLGFAATVVAISIGAFAVASNPPTPPVADLRGADLDGVDLSGASLREANLEGMTIRAANLDGTNLEGAKVDKTVWKDTTCPDGTNSDNAGATCAGHLSPDFHPGPLP